MISLFLGIRLTRLALRGITSTTYAQMAWENVINYNARERKRMGGAKCKQAMNLVGKYSLYFYNSYNLPMRLHFFLNKIFKAR